MAKNKPLRSDQPGIDGLGDPYNAVVSAAAKRYAKRRDERMAANEEEKSAHETLLDKMKEAGLTSYCYKGLEVHLDTTEKAKVKLASDKSAADDGEGE